MTTLATELAAQGKPVGGGMVILIVFVLWCMFGSKK